MPTAPLIIGDRSYGLIPMRFLPTVPDSSTAVPTTSNTQVLLIHQRTVRPKTYPPFWCFPKGHAESHDASIMQTAIRELEEETALKVVLDDLVVFKKGDEEVVIKEVYLNPVKKVGKEVRFWPGIVREEQEITVQTKELAGAEWMSWDEAAERITFSEEKEMLKDVVKLLNERARAMGGLDKD